MIFTEVETMPRKGGKIIGLAKDERGKPTKEVSPTDPSAVEWLDTNTYKTLSKEDALAKHSAVFGPPKTVAPTLTKSNVSTGSPAVGLGRRRTRRGKKTRRTTRRR